MNGGNGNIVSLLERLVEGQEEAMRRQEESTRQLREDMNAGFRHLRSEMNAGFQQLGAGLDQTNVRLDHAITFLGTHHADHELRIKALEDRVFKKPAND